MHQSPDKNVRDRSRDATHNIRRFIEAGITTQTFKPGDKLPTEREIASQFKAGRNTVRKTLDALESEGAIIREVGRGTFVKGVLAASPTFKGPFVGAVPATPLQGLDLAESASPRDLMEFRLSMEPFIAELSVRRANNADIAQMQRAVDQSRRAKSLQPFEDCDDLLHHTIAISTRNPLFAAFAALVTRIRTQGDWGALKKRTLTEKMKETHTVEHVRIVEAIRRRNGNAAYSAMKTHLQNVQAMMFKDDR